MRVRNKPPALVSMWMLDVFCCALGCVTLLFLLNSRMATDAVHANTPEGAAVEVLPPNAIASAAAALVPRWLSGDLPRAHLDSAIPLTLPLAANARTAPR